MRLHPDLGRPFRPTGILLISFWLLSGGGALNSSAFESGDTKEAPVAATKTGSPSFAGHGSEPPGIDLKSFIGRNENGDLAIAGSDRDDIITLVLDETGLMIKGPVGLQVESGSAARRIEEGTFRVPLKDIGRQIVVDTLGGNDTLVVEYRAAETTTAIFFRGGSQPAIGQGDVLEIRGDEHVPQASYDFINANDGSVQFTGKAPIHYRGLEPITSTFTATNVILNYSTAAETITVAGLGAPGVTEVNSTLGEIASFPNPTGSLQIYAGDVGDDVVNIDGFGSGFNAALVIDGEGGIDTININTALNLAGDLDVLAETINLNNGTVASNAGVAGGSITFTGGINLGADVVVNADASSSDGDVTLSATIDGAHSLTVNTSGAVVFGGSVGSTNSLSAVTTDGSGTTVIGGGLVRTTGNQVYGDAVSLTAVTLIAATDVVTNGTLSNGGFELSVDVGGASSSLNGTISGSGSLIKTGNGSLILAAANTYDGGTTVSAGILQVDNSTGSGTGPTLVTVDSGATLTGNGAVAGLTIVKGGGQISPGQSPGLLSLGDLSLETGSELIYELDGLTAGIDHDQISVTGAVDLMISGVTGASLTTTVGFSPVGGGQTFVLIANDSTDPVLNTFDNLPEGALVTFSGRNYVISYVGGDGNDITLTVDPFIYVDVDAPPGGDGTSWANAFETLQDALAVAGFDDELWVAEGVYFPDLGAFQVANAVSSTFVIPSGARLYGGFNGSESNLGDRDPASHITVLSGDIDGDDTVDGNGITRHWDDLAGDNAWHVVSATENDSSTVLDGFTITAGQANGGGSDDTGAALVCNGSSPTLANLHVIGNFSLDRAAFSTCQTTISDSVFEANRAGDVGAVAEIAATYVNTIFINNDAAGQGALFYLAGGTLKLTNCQVVGNTSGNTGAVRVQGTTVEFDNVLFSGNSGGRGSAVEFSGSAGGSIINSTFTANKASTDGGAIRFLSTGTLQITNSILWNNQDASGLGTVPASIFDAGNGAVTVAFSIIQGSGGSGAWNGGTVIDGGSNLDVEPMFHTEVDPGAAPTLEGDFHLLEGSQAVDVGDSSAVTTPTDLDGEARIQGSNVDLGPYEGGDPWVDLAVTKTDGVTVAVAGATVTYTIVASNMGASQATPVSLIDQFPSGLSCSWSSVNFGGATGNTSGAGDLGESLTMPTGSSVAYTATCAIASTYPGGPLSNTATISSPIFDPAPSNNSATDSDTVVTLIGDLAITKGNGTDFLAPGQAVTYTISVVNDGPSQVFDAQVSDVLPPELIFCLWSCQAGSGAACSPAPTADLLDIASLDAGAAVTYTGACIVGSSTTMTAVTNIATISSLGSAADPDPGNNTAIDSDLGPFIFGDGFESGDVSAWSGIVRSSKVLDEPTTSSDRETGKINSRQNEVSLSGG